ncbi:MULTISPECIES: ABC transporter permease [unclassified Rathayibacter]|uniref:ABC transporter permease n=1 Tax=unclassified Rathayibacter TaxID=2609250 RepID=UPI000F4C9704|nr:MULTISPECIES: ABC transporter permease [unclassified Rathayibacter]ROP48064.1 ABC-2 type transport system permease protein [Rathayibacter sp. PhB186]ROS48750.1 ABC-2 type transport system permease protein [Rathayibacter sp. PhB185]
MTTSSTRSATGAGTGAPDGRLSTWGATLLVAEREILSQIRSKAFLVSTVITLVLVIGGIVLGNVLSSRTADATPVAVVGSAASALTAADALDVTEVGSVAEAEELVRAGDVDAALVPSDDAIGFSVLALDEAPEGLVAALSVSPAVELLEPSQTPSGLRTLIGLAFGLVFMLAVLGSGATIMQNTVQEKQSRIVEILLAAVPARALLAGKILGNSVIGVGTAAAIAAASALGLAVTGQTELLDLLSAPLIWFVVFFVFGFVLVASVFAAGAALVSRQEDTGSVMTPAMMLVMVPYFGVVIFGDNPLVMTILSYVPFSAPVAMPVRLFFGEAEWWEPLVSLGLLVVATAAVMAVASRIYTNSLLRMGSRVRLRDALTAS